MLGGLNACVSASNQRANLKQIYDQSAQYHEPDRNPIIVIFGICLLYTSDAADE